MARSPTAMAPDVRPSRSRSNESSGGRRRNNGMSLRATAASFKWKAFSAHADSSRTRSKAWLSNLKDQGSGDHGARAASQSTDRANVSVPTSTSCDTYSTRKGCIGGSRAENPNWSARRDTTVGADRQIVSTNLKRSRHADLQHRPPPSGRACLRTAMHLAVGTVPATVTTVSEMGPSSSDLDGGMCRQVGQRVIC